MTSPVLAFEHVTKRYDAGVALHDVTFAIEQPSIVALVGRNGSGKTTLFNHAIGLALPTTGRCLTLGRPAGELGPSELGRLGMVYQHSRFATWMRVGQLLRHVASFYAQWDTALERQLVESFDLDPSAAVSTLSAGGVQKLAIVLASCHRPELLLLDEPLSDLDPEARAAVLRLLLDCLVGGEVTVLVSSHLLHDLETIIERVLVLDRGRLATDSSLDDLRERHAEWTVTSLGGTLPERWREPWVRAAQGDRFRAVIVVDDPARHLPGFRATYDADVESRPLSLERLVGLGIARGDAGAETGEVGAVQLHEVRGSR